MPHGLRVYVALKAAGFEDRQSLAVAEFLGAAKAPGAHYVAAQIIDGLCDVGMAEEAAAVFADAMKTCYMSSRFDRSFNYKGIKTELVRARVPSACAEAFLNAMEPCVISARESEIRAPIRHAPGPGRVVMCDFTYLIRPEMQKERRAIVISPRPATDTGRCVVVPISKTAPRDSGPHFYRFEPASYPFFHSSEPVWAVCDHVYTVALTRLWKVNVNRRPELPSINPVDLDKIKDILVNTLALRPLTNPQQGATSIALAGE
jgi:uncharacterized protein YifN (PemK superfamily)